MNKIRLSDMINPHFKKLWLTDKPNVVAKGGRGSFKSSVISLKLVTIVKRLVQQHKKGNVICVLANKTDLHDTVYSQIMWAIDMLAMSDEFTAYKSPLRIKHIKTGSTFYFYGADNPNKLKSNRVGDIIAVWFEEIANMKGKDVFDQAIPSFIRQKPEYVDQVKIYYSYNPPRNPYDWINKWIGEKETDSSFYVDTSTYLDDKLGFTTQQQLDLINSYKENDYDYYRWLYLGHVVGLGNNVYNMATINSHALTKLPEGERIVKVMYAIDAGHEVSATTCMQWVLTNKNNVILLDTYYYSPEGKSVKLAPSELSKNIHDFEITSYDALSIKAPIEKRTIDSAEGAIRNQYYKDWGIKLHPVAKEKKEAMIGYTQSLLAQGRVYYMDNDNNGIFIEQMQMYRWDEKTKESDDPKVIKENDHTCDAFQYVVKDNLKLLGLAKRAGYVGWKG